MTHILIHSNEHSLQYLVMDDIHGAVAIFKVTKKDHNVFSVSVTESLFTVTEQALDYIKNLEKEWKK